MKENNSFKRIVKLAEEGFNFISNSLADEKGNIDPDELDIVIDKIKSIKDRLSAFELSQNFTIKEIKKSLKKIKKTDIINPDYIE